MKQNSAKKSSVAVETSQKWESIILFLLYKVTKIVLLALMKYVQISLSAPPCEHQFEAWVRSTFETESETIKICLDCNSSVTVVDDPVAV